MQRSHSNKKIALIFVIVLLSGVMAYIWLGEQTPSQYKDASVPVITQKNQTSPKQTTQQQQKKTSTPSKTNLRLPPGFPTLPNLPDTTSNDDIEAMIKHNDALIVKTNTLIKQLDLPAVDKQASTSKRQKQNQQQIQSLQQRLNQLKK